jgi:hypothetical protein
MKTSIFLFNEQEVTFTLDKNNKVMMNATEMAKVFGKLVKDFMENENTKSFIHACMKPENAQYLHIDKPEDLYVSRQKAGTWMHRVLGLKFAAWLNPAFELWVFSTIDKLLFGKFTEREKSLERSFVLQNEMNILQNKPEKTGSDFERYLEIEYELRKERAVRKNLTNESFSEMKDLFEDVVPR